MMMPSILEKTYLMTGWTSHLKMNFWKEKPSLWKTCKEHDENRCPRNRQQL